MGTKNRPGEFDGYQKAEPDEPMFTLLARDPLAPILVRLWADLTVAREKANQNTEAQRCATQMEEWYRKHRPTHSWNVIGRPG